MIDAVEYVSLNRRVKLPRGHGCTSQSTITFGVYKGQGSRVKAYAWLKSWFYKVFNPSTNEVGIVNAYRDRSSVSGDCEAMWYGPDGNPAFKVLISDMWPSQMRVGSVNRSDENQVLTVPITFEINDLEIVDP